MAVFPDSFLPTRQVTCGSTLIGVESMMLRKRLIRTLVSFTGWIAYSHGRGFQRWHPPRMRGGIRGGDAGLSRGLGRTCVGKPVADARHCQDVIRPRGLGLDLPTEVPDVHVDHPRLDGVLVAP